VQDYFGLPIANKLMEAIIIGSRVKVYLGEKFGDKEGWYQGVVVKIDPYSEHRSFYWVELNAEAQAELGIKQISVFNIKNIQKI
jgi:hypothetical protein